MDRRNFLKGGLFGAIGLGLGKIGLDPPPEDGQTRIIKDGLQVYDKDHWRPVMQVELQESPFPRVQGWGTSETSMVISQEERQAPLSIVIPRKSKRR